MRIFLTGFMAAGKSTVGELLARDLGLEFRDLDREIESRSGESIASFFQRRGEAAFRDLEHSVLCAMLGEPEMVLATGGGLPVLERNRSVMQAAGLTVWLDPPFEEINLRLEREGGGARPLNLDPARNRLLYEARLAAYAHADLRIRVAAGEPPGEVARRIARELRGMPCAI